MFFDGGWAALRSPAGTPGGSTHTTENMVQHNSDGGSPRLQARGKPLDRLIAGFTALSRVYCVGVRDQLHSPGGGTP